ncbi:MAG: lipoyl(octanoyl) transferase LipB [Myxococcota bacterium]
MAETTRKIRFYRLGTLAYEAALELQNRLVDARAEGKVGDSLLLVEHPPTLTLGRSCKNEDHLRMSAELLRASGFAVHHVGRGGDVTYHGPGQLVAYPIFDLKPDRKDVRRYMSDLEEAMIRVCRDYGLQAGRLEGLTGTWIGPRKIGAIGVRIRRWVTMHGVALNVCTNLQHFQTIVPCGIADKAVTSLEAELGEAPPHAEVESRLARHLGNIFHAEIDEATIEELPVTP